MKAQLVSFQAGERAATGTPLSSAAYDSDKVENYFDQAFSFQLLMYYVILMTC